MGQERETGSMAAQYGFSVLRADGIQVGDIWQLRPEETKSGDFVAFLVLKVLTDAKNFYRPEMRILWLDTNEIEYRGCSDYSQNDRWCLLVRLDDFSVSGITTT